MLHVASAAAAAGLLRSGALLAHPTSGLYGLAVDPLSAEGVARLQALKGGRGRHGYIAVAGELATLSGWWEDDPAAALLLATRFSGPVTVVCRRGPRAPAIVASEDGTVALRRDGHPAVAAIAEALGRPFISTSLNLPGHPPAASLRDLPPALSDAVQAAFDLPPRPSGLASTLVAPTPEGPRILRAGATGLGEIEGALARRPEGGR